MMVHPSSPPVVTDQPSTARFMVEPKNGTWSSRIFDCWDDKEICCLGFWCLPCLACQVSSMFGECLCLPLLDILSAGPVSSVAIRSSMRAKYHIQGSIAEDWLLAVFCSSCTWCQLAREMKLRQSQPS
uniref:Plac8 onzin related protein 6 n=1 Tax=Mastacembelus armatus TaxID=205130 RepID=A0A3Q3RQ90_9TELE